MAEPLKNLYSPSFFNDLGDLLTDLVSDFNTNSFIHDIHDSNWEERELKERMVHIADVLHLHFPGDYKASVHMIMDLIREIPKSPLADHSLFETCLPASITQACIDWLSS